MTAKIYFDMDGVLAKWDTASGVEDTFQPEYFLHREPEVNIINALKMIKTDGFADAAVLSAAYSTTNAGEEKLQWLQAQGINVPAYIVPYGHSKNMFVPKNEDVSLLVDDYTRNLRDWETVPNHIGVKFVNGVNSTNGTWEGFRLDYRMDAEHMLLTLKGIVLAMSHSRK